MELVVDLLIEQGVDADAPALRLPLVEACCDLLLERPSPQVEELLLDHLELGRELLVDLALPDRFPPHLGQDGIVGRCPAAFSWVAAVADRPSLQAMETLAPSAASARKRTSRAIQAG